MTSWQVLPLHLTDPMSLLLLHCSAAQLIAALKANPDVYAKTVFLIDYDEGGQFFDHHCEAAA